MSSTRILMMSKPFLRQCFVTGAVCFNIVGHGCSLGFPGVLLPQLHANRSEMASTQEAESWITSIGGIALLVGSFITPAIMENYGRKVAHLAVTLPILFGWIVIILSTRVEFIILGRLLQGISFGMLLPLRSPLIGEYTSPNRRGSFLITVSFAQAFGIFFVHLIGSLISWQYTVLVCLSFSFTSLIMIMYSPETPSWLMAQGRYEECRTVFRWLRGDGEEIELEAMIKARIQFKIEEVEKKQIKVNKIKRFREIIIKKEFFKPIILMFHLYFMVQFAGGAIMAAYSTVIIGILMGPTVNAHFWMIILDAQRILSNILAVFVVTKMKRRTMLFSVGALSVFSHVALAGYAYARKNGILRYEAIWLPGVLVNLQMFSIAIGIVPLPNVIAGEIFPLQFRSIGSTISLIPVSFFFFISLKTFPGLLHSIGLHGTYTLFAVLITYNLIVAWFLLPETKGRTLQEIEDEYRGIRLSVDEQASRQSLRGAEADKTNENKILEVER